MYMGMFDYIRFSINLPRPLNEGELKGIVWIDTQFQTKSLGCFLGSFFVDINGQLWLEEKGKNTKRHDTCSVDFYESVLGEEYDYWVEWTASFEMGNCKSLELKTWKEKDSHERLALDYKRGQRNKERMRFESTFLFRFCFRPWNWLLRRGFRKLNKFLEWLDSIVWKIQRKLEI